MITLRRVLLVDDVPYARDDLKDILGRRHADIEIAGEAENIAKAWALLQADNAIDGVFLDIDLPTESERAGLDFAYNLNRLPCPPWIIFVTGSSKHALEAHQLHPAHYLLKPLEDRAVDAALDWVRNHYPVHRKVTGRIAVKHKIRNRDGDDEFCHAFITLEDVVYVQKNNSASTLKIKLQNGETLDGITSGLKDWEMGGLLQIHRSCLVNLDHVQGLKPRPGEEQAYKVYFKSCPDELPIGPNYLPILRAALTGDMRRQPPKGR